MRLGALFTVRGGDARPAGGYVELMMPKPTTTMPGEAGRLEQAFETLKVDTRGPGLCGADRGGGATGSAASAPPMGC